MKKINFVIFMLAICTLLLTGKSCPFNYYPYTNPKPSPFPEEDRLSSWDSINQLLERPDDWQRIVENTGMFQLGESSMFDYFWINSGTKYTYYNQSYGTFPAIDGSTVLLPLAAEFAWQFLDLSNDNTRNFINFSTTNEAYLKFLGVNYNNNTSCELRFSNHQDGIDYHDVYIFGKQPDIVFTTSPSASVYDIAAGRDILLTVEPVCYDSFVFITHIDNPVNDLTIEQIQGIYSGRITNWSDVGGEDKEITAFQRNPGSGSQVAMEEMVMRGVKLMNAPAGWYHAAMGMMIDFIAEYQNDHGSIGYSFKYYVDRLYKNPKIKIINVDGIEPNDETIKNSSYPFIASYNGVIRSLEAEGPGGKFLNWMLSEEGQKCVAQAGYVPRTIN